MKYPRPIQRLIDLFVAFPSVGPKTAERYVFYLLNQPNERLQELALALAELKEKTVICKTCQAVSDTDPCYICADPKRDSSQLCVTASTRDKLTIESTNEFKGRYLVLGGVLDAIAGIKPEQLKIKELLSLIRKNNPKEIILALNPTIEGETTSLYLVKLLKQSFPKLALSRLAKGLPMGSDLEYADEITLSNALKYRNRL